MTDNTCVICGRRALRFVAGGKLERATYAGAPVGGVPVHRDCLLQFYERLDEYAT